MNIRPWLGFFWKHGSQLQAMVDGGAKPDGHLLVDFAAALVEPIKKHFPALNANGMADDAISALRASLIVPETAPVERGEEH